MQINWNADHTEIIVQKIFACGLIRPVTLNANRIAELTEKYIHLIQRISRNTCDGWYSRGGVGFIRTICQHFVVLETGVHILPCRTVAGLNGTTHCRPLEEHHLPRLGEHRVPKLLGVTVNVPDAVSVHPAAAVAAGFDVLEVTDDFIALILLQMLVGNNWVARFRAGVNAVEKFRFLVEVITKSLKMLIPVWEFNDQFDLWIHRSRRF